MSYTITADVITKEKSQKWLDPGVHSDIELVEHKVETSSKGNVFFAYTYENDAAQRGTRTEWEVDEIGPFDTLNGNLQEVIRKMSEERKITLPEAIIAFREAKVKAQMRRILCVAKIFVTEEELAGKEFASFKDFVTFVSTIIGTRNKGVKLRVKFTFDRKGWVNTPDYVRANTPWIEKVEEVADDKSKIKIVDGLDKIVRPAPAGTRAPKKDNPLEEPVADAPKLHFDKDLPF